MKTGIALRWLGLLSLCIAALAGGVKSFSLFAVAGSDPSQVGQWSAPINWPTVAVNSILLPTGKVLTYQSGVTASVWDPTVGISTSVPLNSSDLFCSGHSLLPDGRVAVIGGYNPNAGLGIPDVNIFDPTSQSWTVAPPMKYARWYPTSTTLPDGRLLATGGASTCTTCYDPIPEVYDPTTNAWTSLTSASTNVPSYPFMFVLPDGRVLKAGASEVTTDAETLDVRTQKWTVVDSHVVDGGSAVMYRPGQIVKAGTAADSGGTSLAAATTYVLDLTQPSPHWRQTASMAYPRAFLNLTSLPDGNVLATGGGTDTTGTYLANAVLPAEMWSPATATWNTMAAMQTPRLYHSTALLLPDGRVLVSGGGADPWDNATDEKNAEIYSPPYLFRGARPTIASAPGTIQYGGSFSVSSPDAASIASVALIAPGAVTHAFNENQRFLNLPFQVVGNTLTITAPATADLAPPGYYMLFIVNGNGVPSVASFVRLPVPATDTVAPSAPSNLTTTVSGSSVTLNWSASTDNVGVTGYNVYRSTTPGFVPDLTTEISTTAATSFNDASIPANGTYYYAVAAVDAAGNISSPSNQASATIGGAATATATSTDTAALSPTPLPSVTATGTPGASATPSPTPLPSATATATPAGSVLTLGSTVVGSQTDSGDANYLNGSRFTTSSSGTVSSMSVHVGAIGASPNNQYQLAVYTDASGSPGSLVAHSATGTLKANVWNTLAISATLSSNTAYWLLYNANGTNGSLNNMQFNGGGQSAYTNASVSFGTWPASFGAATFDTQTFSIYATYSTGAGGVATATSTATTTATPTATTRPSPTPTGTVRPSPTATATPLAPTNTPTATGTPGASATATATAMATGTLGASLTLGSTVVGSQTDSGDANYLNGSRFTTSSSGTVSSMSVHVGAVGATPNNQYQLAIYTDNSGSPGSLVAHSATGTLKANVWNTLPLTATLSPNTAYWLLYNANGSSGSLNNMQFNGGGQSAYTNASVSFGTWPASFGAATFDTQTFSIYATYSGG